MRCQADHCENGVALHFAVIERRRCTQYVQFCQIHADEFWESLDHDRPGVGPLNYTPDASCFDIELIVYDEANPAGWLYLREVRGHRHLSLTTGPVEAWALIHELRGLQTPRPLTHPAMASIISSLGGTLQDVLVNDLIESENISENIYLAKLRIRQRGQQVLVDVRPSDAFILAVICDVPIYIADFVLAKLPA